MSAREGDSGPLRLPLQRRPVWIAGGSATGLALAFMWIASGVVPSIPFPPAAVAELIVRATPGGVVTFFIESLHHWALRLLSLGVLLGTLLFGAEVLWRTAVGDRLRPLVAGGLLAAVALVASLGLSFETTNLVGTIVVIGFAALLYARAARSIYDSSTEELDWDRRRALQLGFGGALGLAVAGGLVGWFARSFAGPDRRVRLVTPEPPAKIPARPDFPDIPGLSAEITSARDHYVVDVDLVTPSVEADGWVLEVNGEVDSPTQFGFSELQERFAVVEEYSVLTCVSNEVGGNLIGNSAWGGVRLADVLDAVGVRDGAVDVIFHSSEGYSDSIPLEIARNPHVLLAVSQNGRPLLQEHGFPCRVRVPSIYGMKNVKWLESIEVVSRDYVGYWQMRGWSDEAVVKTESRIDVAGDDESIEAGKDTWIAGVAWAGERGISKVEVTVDGGKTWNEAMLKEPIGPLAWNLWAYRWTPDSSGSATIACRATDGDGETQTAKPADPHPSGASGYHTVEVSIT
jgi:DMSO/TMAO reductase YedYZ molybdopterin-dependent catalytic subunit